MKQFHIIVSGKVQGVYFRDNTLKKATSLGLKGYVKNLEDGTVEAIAQGSQEKLDKLIDFFQTSPGSSDVVSINIKNTDPIKRYDDFKVKF